MKRILFAGMLAASLILLQPSSAPFAQNQKAEKGWRVEKTKSGEIKVLRLWRVPGLGPQWPQIALMQLTSAQEAELKTNPLKFLQENHIFENTEAVLAEFSVRLMEPKAKGKDPALVVAGHGSVTYSGVATFEVDNIVP
jgi:hypothetical protein